jgi:hypothetical protein
MNLADKAIAAGCDQRTIDLAYSDFVVGNHDLNSRILEAHRRMCIHAQCHDNPAGNQRFPLFGAGVVRV